MISFLETDNQMESEVYLTENENDFTDSSEYLSNDSEVSINDNQFNDNFDDHTWNEEWKAIEQIIPDHYKKYMDANVCNHSIKGIVTQVINEKEIVVDNTHTFKNSVCIHLFQTFVVI